MTKPATILSNIRKAVAERRTEPSERNAVQRVLAEYGDYTVPEITQALGIDAKGRKVGVVRHYWWKGTVAGDFVLESGPSVTGQIKLPHQVKIEGAPRGIYGQEPGASPATERGMAHQVAAAQKYGARLGAPKKPRKPRKPRASGAKFLAKKYGLTTPESEALAAQPELVQQVEAWREANGLPHPASALVRGYIQELIGFERAPEPRHAAGPPSGPSPFFSRAPGGARGLPWGPKGGPKPKRPPRRVPTSRAATLAGGPRGGGHVPVGGGHLARPAPSGRSDAEIMASVQAALAAAIKSVVG